MWRNLAQLVQYRSLIQTLVARDLKARYRGSVLGVFWSFFNPLLLLTIYSFVFTKVIPAGKGAGTDPFPVFLFCGLLPWTWFTTSMNEATVSLISHGNLLKKVLFPAEVLPIVSVVATMVHFFFGLVILGIFEISWGHPPALSSLVWFPVIVVLQFVFTIGIGLLTSALTVHFRDVRDLVMNLLTFWFFATPIIYPYTLALEKLGRYAWVLNLNPFYHLAVAYQQALFFPAPFDRAASLLLMAGVSLVVFVAGYWVFDRLRDSFAEAV